MNNSQRVPLRKIYWQLYLQEHYHLVTRSFFIALKSGANLNDNLRNANSFYKFKNYLTRFIKVKENSTFCISDPLGLKLLTCLCLNFRHINKHKFRHNLRDTVNFIGPCDARIETAGHYLLCCQNCALVRPSFLNRIFEINVEFRNMNDFTLTSLLQFSSEKQTFDLNTKILNLIIQFLKDSSRFDKPLKVHYWKSTVILVFT